MKGRGRKTASCTHVNVSAYAQIPSASISACCALNDQCIFDLIDVIEYFQMRTVERKTCMCVYPWRQLLFPRPQITFLCFMYLVIYKNAVSSSEKTYCNCPPSALLKLPKQNSSEHSEFYCSICTQCKAIKMDNMFFSPKTEHSSCEVAQHSWWQKLITHCIQLARGTQCTSLPSWPTQEDWGRSYLHMRRVWRGCLQLLTRL